MGNGQHFGQGWGIDGIMMGYGRWEHKAGIEWVSGLRLGSGNGFRSGY